MRVSLLFMCISPPVPNQVEIIGLKKWIQVGPVEADPRLTAIVSGTFRKFLRCK